jgi:D-alanyl-D-alanine dipeptidase
VPTLVDVRQVDPRIETSVRYATPENFTGRPVPGYRAPVALLSEPAARALSGVAAKLEADGFRLVVYDAYRPVTAVRAFVAWAKRPSGPKEKRRYFPTIDKVRILPLGYVAERSRHSAASTVDVTLLAKGRNLRPIVERPRRLADGATVSWLDDGTVDMGTSWDFFGPASGWDSALVSAEARRRRRLLRERMVAGGFEPFDDEWWHFSLRDEPFRGQAFDVPVEAP